MVKKVIMNLDSSKVSGPDCIPSRVMVAKNCEPELSYIQAELFNKCLKDSYWSSRGTWLFFLISSMGLDVLDQLQIFWQSVPYKNARSFNSSGAIWAVALDRFKASDRVWHVSLFHKRKFYGSSGRIFGHNFSFLSNRWLRVVLDEKSSQEYPVNAGFPHSSILGPTLFLLCINDFPDDVTVILLSMLTILFNILGVIWHLICGNN